MSTDSERAATYSRGLREAVKRFSLGWAAALPLFIFVCSTPTVGAQQAAGSTVDLQSATDVARIDGEEDTDRTGIAVASCDINGDGIDDLLIGADEAHGIGNSKTRVGEAYIIYGHKGKWSGSYDLSITRDVRVVGQQPYDHLGIKVACGDVNGDGYDDAILTADNADSLGDARTQAGQCHIVFGSPSLPAVIDLAIDAGTVLWGAREPDTLECIAVGDVDGDGLPDVLAGADNSRSKNNALPDVGKLHVVFGRTNWPAEIDLLAGSDVTIWGPSDGDVFSSSLAAGDLDGDGISEIIATARLGDGEGNSRQDAGDVYLFRGRTVWPGEIDLEHESPDTLLIGADSGDQAGEAGIGIGDRDEDGTAELIIGHRLGDGSANVSPETGESRHVVFGQYFPGVVDFSVDTDGVIYGVDQGDTFCENTLSGDTNGDLVDDHICDSPRADGPNETRSRAGEATVVFGSATFSSEIDLSLSDPDVIVFGALSSDKMRLRELSDVNADGIRELVLSTATTHYGRKPTIWLVSPVDSDGDGVTNLDDNCPLVVNPTQGDSDGDLVGDDCQSDYDGDGEPDASDCAPYDGRGGTPPPVDAVQFSVGSKNELVWNQAQFADSYDVLRGDLFLLSGSNFGECRNEQDDDLGDLRYSDDEVPGSGSAYCYLIRARDLQCPAVGSWGTASSGIERQNTNAADCQ